MSRMRVSILTLALLLGGLLCARPAQAQGKPDYAAARKHYVNAQAAEKAGDYDTAVSEYAAAYDITKDAKILYSVAKAYEAGGNKDAAVVYYRRYVNEAKEAKDRDEVKKHIAELEGTPATPPPPPHGNDVITPPPPSPTGGETGTGTGETQTGDGEIIQPLPGQGIGDAPALSDGGSRWQRTAGWAAVGVAAVALTTGAVLGESALSREEDIQRLQDFRDPQGNPTRYNANVRKDYEDSLDEGKKMETYSLVAFSVAGAAAVAAVIFFAIDPGAPEAPEAVSRRFFTPVVTPDGVGIAAGWGF